ncbi:hypothetical protein ACPESR_25430 [Nocardia testacea]|uniref:hypothetical protein n=1 Tax=Nocardia testacea TaxID=248551 RepID=UPI003C2C96DC
MTAQDWKPGREAAEKALRGVVKMADGMWEIDGSKPADLALAHRTMASMATVATPNALLAIETRLGELVEQQRISNAIAGVQLLRGFNHAELNQAREKVRDIVRDLLDLAPKTDTTPGTETP